MSDSLRPHRRQPTRLLCPWDSPGKNTGVGCHILLQRMHAWKVASVVSDSVRPYGQQPTRLLCPQDSLGNNTGVGCHFPSPAPAKTLTTSLWDLEQRTQLSLGQIPDSWKLWDSRLNTPWTALTLGNREVGCVDMRFSHFLNFCNEYILIL